jgi:hypothetical protein
VTKLELPFFPLDIDAIRGMSDGMAENSTAVELSNGVTVGVCTSNASDTGSEESKLKLFVELDAVVKVFSVKCFDTPL